MSEGMIVLYPWDPVQGIYRECQDSENLVLYLGILCQIMHYDCQRAEGRIVNLSMQMSGRKKTEARVLPHGRILHVPLLLLCQMYRDREMSCVHEMYSDS